ncbi:MAG: hypothetical protein GC152_01135 [Alphaproteobacteria bacterium]|nr:hypothetical protein [Alphaproteobacteria bacterium]
MIDRQEIDPRRPLPGVMVTDVATEADADSAIAAGAFAISFATSDALTNHNAAEMAGQHPMRRLSAYVAAIAPRGLWRVLCTTRQAGEIADEIHAAGATAVHLPSTAGDRDRTIVRAAHPSVKIIQALDARNNRAIEFAQSIDRQVDAFLVDCAPRPAPTADPSTSLGARLAEAWARAKEISDSCASVTILAGELSRNNLEAALLAATPAGAAISIRTTPDMPSIERIQRPSTRAVGSPTRHVLVRSTAHPARQRSNA